MSSNRFQQTAENFIGISFFLAKTFQLLERTFLHTVLHKPGGHCVWDVYTSHHLWRYLCTDVQLLNSSCRLRNFTMPGCVAGSAFIYCLSSNLEIQKFPPFIPKMHSQTRNSSKGLVVPQWLNLHLRRLIHLSFEVTRVPSPSLKTVEASGITGKCVFSTDA